MRRTILIVVALLLLIGVGVGVWFFFFRTQATDSSNQGNPFGDTGAGGNGSTEQVLPDVDVPLQGAGNEVAPQLYKITAGPVAEGAVAVDIFIPQVSEDTSTPALPPLEDVEVRYVDRASGNLYRFQLGARILERLTNRTLPGIQQASWASDGSRAFVRFISNETGTERFETYSLPASGGDGYLLEPGLSDVLVSGTSSVLTVLPTTNGSVATRSTLLGENAVTAFSTTLSALRVFTAGLNYAAITKPSAVLPGYAFSINRTSGEFTRLLGPLAGLTLLPNSSGTKFLYGTSANGSLALSLFDGATSESTALPVSTLADKCVWNSTGTAVYCAVPRSVTGTLPDDWYLGVVSTSDRIWKIDLSSRVASLVFDPKLLADTDIDAVSLSLDAKDDVLVFMNKQDGSLWLYDI